MVMSECHLKLTSWPLPIHGLAPPSTHPVVSGSLGLLLMGLNFAKLMSFSLDRAFMSGDSPSHPSVF